MLEDQDPMPEVAKKKRNVAQQERKSRSRFHKRERKRQENAQKKQEKLEEQRRTLATLFQCELAKVHVYHVSPDTLTLERLQQREREKGRPLARADVDELVPEFLWINEPGYHFGFAENENYDLVLAVKATDLYDMPAQTRAHTESVLQLVMDFSDNSYSVKNNAAGKHTAVPTIKHGTRGRNHDVPITSGPWGTMYGIGWHGSQEPGKTLVNYAPVNKDAKSMQTYMARNARVAEIAEFYRDGFARLYPGGVAALEKFAARAAREGVVSLGDALDGRTAQKPFANSLTATLKGFCNFLHTDRDAAEKVYGGWLQAEAGEKGSTHKWTPINRANHRTRGGEIIWGAFKIGVEFASLPGLVEIYWRGQYDHHATLESTDEPGYTRFGTSVQITKAGLFAMRKLWTAESLEASGHDLRQMPKASSSRVTTAQDRAERANASASLKRKRKTT